MRLYAFWEPLESWRFFARQGKRILELAAATYNGQTMERAFTEDVLARPPSTGRSGRRRRAERRRERAVRLDRSLYVLHERKNIYELWLGDLSRVAPAEVGKGRDRQLDTLTRQRAFVSYAVNCWLNWGRARPQLDWQGPTPTIELTTGGMLPMYADRLSGALALQLAYAVASAEGVATCFACGRFYTPTRRPAAGRRSFCRGCGLRAAWRTSKRIARGRFGPNQV